MAAIPAYDEVVVRGSEFVGVRLTPEAYAHGLALPLPQAVVVRAMPSEDGRGKVGHWRARQELGARMPLSEFQSREAGRALLSRESS